MGLKKIVRYTCSTKVSSFIPIVLNAVATVLLVVFGLVKYSMDDIEPAEKHSFTAFYCVIVLVLSFTFYNAYRYKKPVDVQKVVVLNNLLSRLYLRSRMLFALLVFIAHLVLILLLRLVFDWIDYGTVKFFSSLIDIIKGWIVEACLLGLSFTALAYNDYYSYFKSK